MMRAFRYLWRLFVIVFGIWMICMAVILPVGMILDSGAAGVFHPMLILILVLFVYVGINIIFWAIRKEREDRGLPPLKILHTSKGIDAWIVQLMSIAFRKYRK